MQRYRRNTWPMITMWAVFAGGVTVATSQTTRASGTDLGAVLIALITAGGAIGAAWGASRYRNRGRDVADDEVIISREEYDRLRRRARGR